MCVCVCMHKSKKLAIVEGDRKALSSKATTSWIALFYARYVPYDGEG